MDRSNYPDGEGWINPRITRVPAGSRVRGLISSASRRRGSASPTGGGEGRASLTGGLADGEDEASPTGGVPGGEGRASPTGGLASGEGDASYEVTDSPVMSDEEYVRRYVITEAGKEAWERNKAEAERKVKAFFGENCLDP
ncbi:hypothetical protein SASPL_121386 [Salvia splendens]|uniref:Uncharacterized protein n=1 Tax=Salvia splendens TaxID=180675 RepID=A0A8X8ZX72_SALSN|nr:hypothetical protein SASPL_121386 [Salvia splendens]